MLSEKLDDGFVSLRVSVRYVTQVTEIKTCDNVYYLFGVRRNHRKGYLQCHSFFRNKSKRLHKTFGFRDTRNHEMG
jgi:hypothetical protein